MRALRPLPFLALVLAAGEAAFAGGTATTGFNLLKVTTGTRQMAMGGAATAMPGNLAGIITNPALLSFISSRSIELVHWPGVAGLRTEFVSYSIPISGVGTWAGTVLYRTLPTIDNVTYEDPVGINDGMLMMTLGRPVGKTGTQGGLTLKVFNSTLGEVRATSAALDLGMIRSTGGPYPIRWGGSLTNIGTPVRVGSVGEPLPLAVRGGASWSRGWYPHTLTLSGDGMANLEQDMRVAVGAEWLQAGKLAMRAGTSISLHSGWTFGFGAGWRFRSTALGPEAEYIVDYAFLPFAFLTALQPTHALSVLIVF